MRQPVPSLILARLIARAEELLTLVSRTSDELHRQGQWTRRAVIRVKDLEARGFAGGHKLRAFLDELVIRVDTEERRPPSPELSRYGQELLEFQVNLRDLGEALLERPGEMAGDQARLNAQLDDLAARLGPLVVAERMPSARLREEIEPLERSIHELEQAYRLLSGSSFILEDGESLAVLLGVHLEAPGRDHAGGALILTNLRILVETFTDTLARKAWKTLLNRPLARETAMNLELKELQEILRQPCDRHGRRVHLSLRVAGILDPRTALCLGATASLKLSGALQRYRPDLVLPSGRDR